MIIIQIEIEFIITKKNQLVPQKLKCIKYNYYYSKQHKRLEILFPTRFITINDKILSI